VGVSDPLIRYRSAITGRFVSKAFADANPDVTVCVTIIKRKR
jgi:hypothetical protein